MKKILALVLLCCFYSCNDGDIIVTDFDFEGQTLERCTDFDFVFFVINSEINETLALQFTTNALFLEEEGEVEVQLSSSNNVVYRRFDGEVTSSYFCSPIPPASPLVIEEFTSTAGTATLFTQGISQDDDGIPSDVEDPLGSIDTDGDGLIDIIDFDDDGDNVPTILEGVVLDENGNVDLTLSRDTDVDGIPDYLDEDDDGDGVLTRNEDLNGDLDPTNDRTDENAADDYLNSDVAVETLIEAYRDHTYMLVDIEVTVTLTNLDFRNSNGDEVIRDITQVLLGTLSGLSDITMSITPDFTN